MFRTLSNKMPMALSPLFLANCAGNIIPAVRGKRDVDWEAYEKRMEEAGTPIKRDLNGIISLKSALTYVQAMLSVRSTDVTLSLSLPLFIGAQRASVGQIQ